MAFTEFFCRSGGSNLNGGGLSTGAEPNTTPVYSGVGDSDGTSVFTPSDGSTPASTVTVGDFASVYVTIGATVAVFIGRVTTVAAGVNGAITCSTTAKSGTFPAASAGAHTITCNVGGAWKGPNAASGFPFGFVTSTLTDSSNDSPRINFKNDATYSITAAITHSGNGPIRFQGYTGSPADGGKGIIDGGTSGTSYVLMTVSGTNVDLADMILQHNGATGTANGASFSGSECTIRGCVVNNVLGSGFACSGTSNVFLECEAYTCNTSNTSNAAGFTPTGGTNMLIRCISHDNSGSNNLGFNMSGAIAINCIADTNGKTGFFLNTGTLDMLYGCDAYNNVGDGADIANAALASFVIENCNFVKNGTGGTGYGINSSGSSTARNGSIRNCGFGSGTQANTTGAIASFTGINVVGTVTYASGVTPWVDPANGDFRINLATAKNAGRGTFTQTAASYTGTVGYPDIGSAQHLDAGGILINPGMSGGLG